MMSPDGPDTSNGARPDNSYSTITPDSPQRPSNGKTETRALASPVGNSKKESQSTELVKLAQATYRFGQDQRGKPFAVPIDGPRIARGMSAGDGSFKTELASAYFAKFDRTSSRQALTDAQAVLEGHASQAEREDVAVRIGRHSDQIIIDLGLDRDTFVVIGPGRFEVTDRSPITFRRTALTMALPSPTGGSDPEDLRELLNVSDDDLHLLWGWLVATLFSFPIPIVFLNGEQGTGKTGAASVLTRLVDPSPAPVRAAAQNLEQWITAAQGSHFVALDNLSTIQPWMSDALCRASTGEGLVKRALYTDDGLAVIQFRKAIILTSIDVGSIRGDLGERLVSIELERITTTSRRTDAELEERFRKYHPDLFGALCQLASQVLAVLPDIHLDGMPRMADFAQVLAAVDEIMGWRSLDHYLSSLERVSSDVLAGDPLGAAITELVDARGGRWIGTAADLLNDLEPHLPEGAACPKTASTLGGVMKRLAPALRSSGIEVGWVRTSSGRTIELTAVASKRRDSGDSNDGLSGHLSVPVQKKIEEESTNTEGIGASQLSLLSPLSSVTPAGNLNGDVAPLAVSVFHDPHPGLGPCSGCGNRSQDLDTGTCSYCDHVGTKPDLSNQWAVS